MINSLNLIDRMDEVINVIGNPVKGAGWYGPTTGIHTVAISVQNFRGRISIQASIVNTPSSDSDWFSVLPGNVDYIEHPQNSFVVKQPKTGETSTFGFTFISNVIWVRALVMRDYIIPVYSKPSYIGTFGLVNSILLNY
jgi:hypothetical protein